MLHELCRDENSRRWAEFVRIYTPVIRYYLGGKIACPEVKKDITQEVLLALAKAFPNFTYDKTKGNFRAFLRRIVAHKHDDYFRALYKPPKTCEFDETSPPPEALHDTSGADAELHDMKMLLIQRAMERVFRRGRFAPNTQPIFTRFAIEGVAAADVAAEFGVTPNNVYQIKNRVTASVEAELKSVNGGDMNLIDLVERLIHDEVRKHEEQ